MNVDSLLPLFEAPKRVPKAAKELFKSLVDPLWVIRCYYFSPSVFHLADKQFDRSYLGLQKADLLAEKALEQIDGIARQTWKAGYKIRVAIGPILQEVFGITFLPDDRKRITFAVNRKRLTGRLNALEFRSLLENLRDAISLENELFVASDESTMIEHEVEYVKMDRAAALVGISKKHLERKLNNDPESPRPDIEGGGGKAHEWIWKNIRPWLEKSFSRRLPPRLPTIKYPT